ncbi:replication initiator protein A [Deinococcus sp.]|uniref:replication initiator protein A n=1 Tax=Deinococcus sp. TaxID=47478 RepID=UPI003CC54173
MATRPKQVKRFDEINVSQLSLISVQERIPADFREWTVEHVDEQRRYKVVCQALPEYGVPHGTDNDISAALINLFIEQGLPDDGTVNATPYLILQAAGLDTSGRYYEALGVSLKRLVTTNFFISEGWRDHPRRRWTTASFRYIDRLEYTSTSGEEQLDPTSVLKIHLPAELVRSVRAGYIKALDLAFMQSLKRPPTRALYRLLDARRYNPEDPEQRVASFQVGLMEWAQACKIVSDRPSLVERALGTAHEELIERGFLSAVNFYGRGQKKVIEYVFGKIADPPDPQLVARLTLIGLTRIRAQQLVQLHGQDLVEDALDRFAALISSGYKPRSKAAFFVDLLKHPEKYQVADDVAPLLPIGTEVAEKRKRQSQALKKQEEEEQATLEESLQKMSHEEQVEEVMRVALVMLRGDLKTSELDAFRQLLHHEDPLALRQWLLRGVANGQRDAVIHDLRTRLNSL